MYGAAMSDLLNTYTELHSQFIDLLVQYNQLHHDFLYRQSPRRTGDLRKVLKEMRLVCKGMEETAQARMKERRVEWNERITLQRKIKNERNNSSN